MTITPFEDIFKDSAEKKTEAPQKSEPSPQVEPAAIEAVEPSQSAGTGEKNAGPPPADEEPSDVHGLRAALRAERQKRQESGTKLTDYEKRLAAREKELAERDAKVKEYEATVAKFQQPPPVAQQQQQFQPDVPDPLLDPEGAIRHVEQKFQKQLFEHDVKFSQKFWRSKHDDYDAVEAVFIEEAKKNPHLIAQMVQSDDQGGFAYTQGKRLMMLREIGDDPAAYRERLRKEVEADLLAKAEPSNTKTPTIVHAPPTSLAGVTSAVPRDARKSRGPTPFSDILK